MLRIIRMASFHCITCYYVTRHASSVARGMGAMRHLQLPSQNCYALDRMVFFHFIYKILALRAKMSNCTPQDKFLAMPPRHAYVTTYSGLFGDLGLLRVDNVHDEAAFAHLSEAGLDDERPLHSFQTYDGWKKKPVSDFVYKPKTVF